MIGSGNKTLKVCKIDSISFASFAIKQQVDFLDVNIFNEEDIGRHLELIEYIKVQKGKPIIVTKIQDLNALQKLIETYKPTCLQLHFEIQVQLVSNIRQLFPKLLLFGVLTNH